MFIPSKFIHPCSQRQTVLTNKIIHLFKIFLSFNKMIYPSWWMFQEFVFLTYTISLYEYAIICLFIFLPINLWPISSIELLLIKSLWHSYRNMFVGISSVSITTRGIYVWSSRCIFNFTRNFFQSDCTILYSHSKCCMHDNI